MTDLLAKSPRGALRLSLHRHLLDTEAAASRMFRAGTRWAEAFLRFFKLDRAEHARFLLHLRIAALFHDLGKANQTFMDAILKRGTQVARHEHLSALVLCHDAVVSWLSGNADLDQDTVVAAVLSHHLKAALSGDYQVLAGNDRPPVPFYLSHPQVLATMNRIAAVGGLTGALPTLPTTYGAGDPSWDLAFRDMLDSRWCSFEQALRRDPRRRAFCLAVKAALIAADSVASAAFRVAEGGNHTRWIERWIEEVCHADALASDEVEDDVLRPRVAELEAKLGRSFAYHPFQLGVANVGDRALLLAGCGMGKTLAAWKWADSVARRRPIGRVVFLYPTRGTATEGFRDYVGHAPEGKAKLVHGTAAYALQGMLANPSEPPPPSLQGKSFVPDEAEERLFSLGLWSKRYFSATVDQFLGFMQHDYRGICLVPALADAAVIFDEVHSYDPTMWQALVDFLRNFDVPVLCMTATLPRERRADLAACHLRAYPDEDEAAKLTELADLEGHERYQLEQVDDKDEALARVVAAARPGTKILWVVNTVRRCQQLAAQLLASVDANVLVYHSRFKLTHREAQHRATVNAFQQTQGRPIIAVTTQVCEMSLDLDADLLVTEHAPVSSLVQRFGRANRHLRRGRDFRGRLITYPPESMLPYTKEDLDAAGRFLAALGAGAISQARLASMLLTHSPKRRRAPADASEFLNGGYFATRAPFRDTDGSSVQAILDSDRDEFLRLDAAEQPTEGLLVPVPRNRAERGPHPGLPPWLSVAKGERYSARYGFIVDDELLGLDVSTEVT